MLNQKSEILDIIKEYSSQNIKKFSDVLNSIKTLKQYLTVLERFYLFNRDFAPSVLLLSSQIHFNRHYFHNIDTASKIAAYLRRSTHHEYEETGDIIPVTHEEMALKMLSYFDSNVDFIRQDALRKGSAIYSQYQSSIIEGYCGTFPVGNIFSGMGFHLSSECAASEEFKLMFEKAKSLISGVPEKTDINHPLHWLEVHIEVEVLHAEDAIRAISLALGDTVDKSLFPYEMIIKGIQNFFNLQNEFILSLKNLS